MGEFNQQEQPEFRIREHGFSEYVIDVHWPRGAVEQLVGMFISREHAAQWLLDGGAETI